MTVLCVRAYAGHAELITRDQAYTLPFFRGDALLVGVICAILIRNEKVRSCLHRQCWVLYALAAVLGVVWHGVGSDVFAQPDTPLIRYGLSVVALFWGTVLLLAAVRPGPLKLLRFRPFVALGKVSYFLYLTHLAAILAIRELLVNLGANQFSANEIWFVFSVGFFGLFMFAQLSWELFESRMVHLGHCFRFMDTSLPSSTIAVEAPEIVASCATD
jgi:peptidoglycan/LPS O-acetylase OafA/YrhL